MILAPPALYWMMPATALDLLVSHTLPVTDQSPLSGKSMSCRDRKQ